MTKKTKRRIKSTFIHLTAMVLTLLTVFLSAPLIFANGIYPEAQGIVNHLGYAFKNKSSGKYLTLPGYFDVFPSDEAEEPYRTVYQNAARVNDQYARSVRLTYDTATGKYTLCPLLFENLGGGYVGVASDGKVEFQTAESANAYWVIQYDANKGGYILTAANGKALTSGNNKQLTTSTYTGADTQIWIAESLNPVPHMIKSAESIEKKNIGREQEWIFHLHTSEMSYREIIDWRALANGYMLEVRHVGDYLIVKVTNAGNQDSNERFSILEITLDNGEKRSVVIQDSGSGNGDGCRTFPLSFLSESKEIEIADGEEQAQVITFNSGVGNVNITEWEIISNTGCIEFYTHNGMNVLGSNYAIINAYDNGFAVIKAKSDDGYTFTTAVEVIKYTDGMLQQNNYVIDIETENITEASIEIQQFKNYLIRTTENFGGWQTNFDETLGYHPGTLVAFGYDFAVVSAEFGHNFTLTALGNSGRSLPITVSKAKGAIIIVPGIMCSQIFANEEIVIEGNDSIENTFEVGTRLWDPAIDFEVLETNEKILALAMNEFAIPLYDTYVNEPTINVRNKTDNGFQYGAQDMYRNIYNELYDNYYTNYGYDIVLFEYDWRYDPYNTARELDSFIEIQGYRDVIFLCHSMGGNVVSQFIAMGTSQRAKINKNISIGTPYLGAAKLVDTFITGKGIEVPFGAIVGFYDAVKQIAFNIPSVYSLLPYEQNFVPYLSYYNGIDVDTLVECDTYSNTINVLFDYIPNWNAQIANIVIENQSKLFLSNGNHVTTLVDTYYIVGDGFSTVESLRFVLPEGANVFNTEDTDIADASTAGYTYDGDSTVTVYSATIGGTLSPERVFYKVNGNGYDSDHTGMIKGDDDETTIKFVCDIIELDVFEIDNIDTDDYLYNNYGIYRGLT